jgi:hypothetical protein
MPLQNLTVALALLAPTSAGTLDNAPPPVIARDPNIEKILAEISTDRIRSRIEKLAAFGTRHTLSDTKSDVRGIGAARRWIKSELDRIAADSGGRLEVELDSYVQEPRSRVRTPTEVVNIVATLRGTQAESKGRVLVVGGHYDSICSSNDDHTSDAPGANDDASGTAVVLELAEVMAKHDFDATVVFVAFAGEEQGLLGSTHFARNAAKNGMKIEAMITNDIVGNTEGSNGVRDNRSVRVFSEGIPAATSPLAARLRAVGGENDGPSRQLARYIDEAAALYHPQFDVRLIFRPDRYLRGGDHMPFLAEGYAAVRFTEPAEAYTRQHQNVRTSDGVAYGDVVERVDFPYVASVARTNAAALASLALAPPPPADPVIVPRLENDTTLRWAPSGVPDLAGYEIVWRDTTAPMWERSLYIGNATTFTLKELSKDNLHFGVRSLDREGHRSLVAFPLPPVRRPAGTARDAQGGGAEGQPAVPKAKSEVTGNREP